MNTEVTVHIINYTTDEKNFIIQVNE